MNYVARGPLLPTIAEIINTQEEIDTLVRFELTKDITIPTDDLIINNDFLGLIETIINSQGKISSEYLSVFKDNDYIPISINGTYKGKVLLKEETPTRFHLKATIKYLDGRIEDVNFHFILNDEMRKKLETFNRMVGTGVIENKTSEQVTNILNLFGTNSGNDNNYNPKIDIVA